MIPKWIEALTGPLDQKKQYRDDMARMKALPEPYATVAQAIHRYLLHFGIISDGELLVRMVTDHVDLWERAAVDHTPVREIVGDDPVTFTEEFVRAYDPKEWLDKERNRLTTAVDRALEESPS